MTDVVDEWQLAAQTAIDAMRNAAIRARELHARAELMRHMRATAAKLANRDLAEAAALVTAEWMKAWQLDGSVYTDLKADVVRFALAFSTDARGSTVATQRAIREAVAGLDAALGRAGTTLADQMAWRSKCAHGWWELVVPTPTDLPSRSGIPHQIGKPFWENGCPSHCLPT